MKIVKLLTIITPRRWKPYVRDVTMLRLCDDAKIPADERLVRLLDDRIFSAKELRLFACKWAERALTAEKIVDRVEAESFAAIRLAKLHAHGQLSDQELEAAHKQALGVVPSTIWVNHQGSDYWRAVADSTKAAAEAASKWPAFAAYNAAWREARAAFYLYGSSDRARRNQLNDVRNVLTWNDSTKRTREAVDAAFERAAVLAESEGK